MMKRKLCYEIVLENFSLKEAIICDTILSGIDSITQMIEHSKLSFREVRKSLQILIQHNIIKPSKQIILIDEENEEEEDQLLDCHFNVLYEGILIRIKLKEMSKYASIKMGDLGREIFNELLREGKMKKVDLINQIVEKLKDNDVGNDDDDNEEMEDLEKIRRMKKDLEGVFNAMKNLKMICPVKKRNEIEEGVNIKNEDMMVDDENVVEERDNYFVKVNYMFFVKMWKQQDMKDYVCNKIGINESSIICSMIQINIFDDNTDYIEFKSIYSYAKDNFQMFDQNVFVSSVKNLVRNNLIIKEDYETDFVNNSYKVHYDRLNDLLRIKCMIRIIEEKFHLVGVFIFNLLLEKKELEEDRFFESSFTKEEISKCLFEMLSYGILNLFELKNDTKRIKIWKVSNSKELMHKISEEIYLTIVNLKGLLKKENVHFKREINNMNTENVVFQKKKDYKIYQNLKKKFNGSIELSYTSVTCFENPVFKTSND